MDINKICPFNGRADVSRWKLLEILEIKELAEQPVSQIQIKFPKVSNDITIIDFTEHEDGDFVGAFFEYVNRNCEESENGWFVFLWGFKNQSFFCFGEEFSKLPPRIIDILNHVNHNGEVLIKVVYK